jgi:hypothetical protein
MALPELARFAIVPRAAIRDFESDVVKPKPDNLLAIRQALVPTYDLDHNRMR